MCFWKGDSWMYKRIGYCLLQHQRPTSGNRASVWNINNRLLSVCGGVKTPVKLLPGLKYTELHQAPLFFYYIFIFFVLFPFVCALFIFFPSFFSLNENPFVFLSARDGSMLCDSSALRNDTHYSFPNFWAVSFFSCLLKKKPASFVSSKTCSATALGPNGTC